MQVTEAPPGTIPTERYFTCAEHLVELLERKGRQMAFRAQSAEEARTWQRELRVRVDALLGLHNMESCGRWSRVTERTLQSGYWRERVEVQTEPEVTAVLYVLLPHDLKPGERRPVVLALHGHVSAGKCSPAGRRDIPVVAKYISELNYDYGEALVREGWVVFCPDARGFGERRESSCQGDDEQGFIGSSCHQLAHMGLPLGQTVTGMWVWDLMRLIDYAATRPDCDVSRLACAGLSGGGLQTLYLAALDERVRCAVISGYFYGVRDSLLHMSDNCCCNFVPGLWLLADMGDLGALCAPRPLFIETGDEDSLNGARGLVNVTEQVTIARQAYIMLEAEDHLHHAIFHGPHRWDGVEAIPWLRKWLGSLA